MAVLIIAYNHHFFTSLFSNTSDRDIVNLKNTGSCLGLIKTCPERNHASSRSCHSWKLTGLPRGLGRHSRFPPISWKHWGVKINSAVRVINAYTRNHRPSHPFFRRNRQTWWPLMLHRARHRLIKQTASYDKLNFPGRSCHLSYSTNPLSTIRDLSLEGVSL